MAKKELIGDLLGRMETRLGSLITLAEEHAVDVAELELRIKNRKVAEPAEEAYLWIDRSRKVKAWVQQLKDGTEV